jgi:porphobilinogen synthase
MIQRPRRLRQNLNIRRMMQETRLSTDNLIMPLFLCDGEGQKQSIASMPGQYRYSLDLLMEQVDLIVELGIPCVSLFPACADETKDRLASESHNSEHFYQKGIQAIKQKHPNLLVMTDVAMDPYSSDGHDGVVDPETGEILNDQTLEILGKMALTQAKSGSDIIGPSDMMDGRVGYIRDLLDENGFQQTMIMSYTAKYASAFYGPFRDALESAPKSGDKKTYQMDFANSREALKEAELDYQEGADILMVKPGIAYLDIVHQLKEEYEIPISVYQVSGEYAMIKAAAQNGWINEKDVVLESLMAFRRAGASMILTYFAMDVAKELKN